MSEVFQGGATSKQCYVMIRSKVSTPPGMGLTGLVYNTSGLAFTYTRDSAAAADLTLATWTPTGSWVSGGFVEVDAAKAPGLYRLGIPNAVIASGVEKARITWHGANTVDDGVDIDLLGYDPLTMDKNDYKLASDGLNSPLTSPNIIETNLSILGVLRGVAAIMLGNASGLLSETETFAAAVTAAKTRVTGTLNSDGTVRTVTLDLS